MRNSGASTPTLQTLAENAPARVVLTTAGELLGALLTTRGQSIGVEVGTGTTSGACAARRDRVGGGGDEGEGGGDVTAEKLAEGERDNSMHKSEETENQSKRL